jgi:hypothetical protein
MERCDFEGVVDILGETIENPKLRRVLKDRLRVEFFNFGGSYKEYHDGRTHTDRHDDNHQEHHRDRHKDWDDHRDYNTEDSMYSKLGYTEHTDRGYSEQVDIGYSEHTDFWG